jgi:pyrroloquinoline-quinone synthase
MERNFWEELETRIAKYDLLKHPIYQAWTEGRLSREDLRRYAAEYYHHVAAFPDYLQEFVARLPEGDLRHAVLGNIEDELGVGSPDGRPHHALWLDFAESVGATAEQVQKREPLPEIRELISTFQRLAREGSPAAALAAFYAYESQVPRVAQEKARSLRGEYAAD